MTVAPPPEAEPTALVPRCTSVWIGVLAWIVLLMLLHPSPMDTGWAVALLLLAPLVLVPLALRLLVPVVGRDRFSQFVLLLQPLAAFLLAVAYLLPQGPASATLALPWLLVTSFLALLGLKHLWNRPWASPGEASIVAALVYISIGGFWAVLDRWGARPLQFEPVIVLLTAIHFHYAGFTLPLLTGLAVRQVSGPLPRLAVISVVVAVPLVAIGITVTQVSGEALLECVSAGLLATAGLLTAWLYCCLALQRSDSLLIRALWSIASVSLAASMVLAAAYGMRFYVPLPWLDIPWMRAWHGTANALGFGLAGLAGWTLAEYRLVRTPGEVLPSSSRAVLPSP